MSCLSANLNNGHFMPHLQLPLCFSLGAARIVAHSLMTEDYATNHLGFWVSTTDRSVMKFHELKIHTKGSKNFPK